MNKIKQLLNHSDKKDIQEAYNTNDRIKLTPELEKAIQVEGDFLTTYKKYKNFRKVNDYEYSIVDPYGDETLYLGFTKDKMITYTTPIRGSIDTEKYLQLYSSSIKDIEDYKTRFDKVINKK